jgi:hypothetical protein
MAGPPKRAHIGYMEIGSYVWKQIEKRKYSSMMRGTICRPIMSPPLNLKTAETMKREA